MYSLSRFCAVLILVPCLLSSSLSAQTKLSRISKVDRKDGLGYVVRFHFSERIDSFSMGQPSHDLVQIALYANSIDTSDIRLFSTNEEVKDISFFRLANGFGIDLTLDDEQFYIAKSYRDQNQKDILLAFKRSYPPDVKTYTSHFTLKNWYLDIDKNTDPLEVPALIYDNSYNTVKDKLRFDTIVIDAGHGGHDPGTRGYKGAREKDITLSIAKKLGNYIEQNIPSVKVVYTRTDDTYKTLQERGHIANVAQGDLFVSIHCDAWHQKSVRGTTTFFLGLHKSDASFEVMKRENSVFKNETTKELTEEDLIIYELAHSGYISTSEHLATMVDKQFTSRAGRVSRGVKQAGFQVLFEASMPALLIETGFITNPSEMRFLTSDYGQSIIASAIYRAIRDYKLEYEKSSSLSSGQ